MNLRRLWPCIPVIAVFIGCYLMYMYFLDAFAKKEDITTILLRQISEDHPYRPVLEMDNKTHFLDSEVKEFLAKTHPTAFPTRYNAVFLETLLEFDRIWTQVLNRSYMMYAGTLLGAIRHGDRTPWDDDLDLVVHIKYNKTIRNDFNGSKLFVDKSWDFRKVYFTHNGTTTNRYGHWPFIDLFFYYMNGTKMVVSPYSLQYEAKDVFPPSEVSYMGHKFPAPRCSNKFTLQTHGALALKECYNYGYSHRLDIHTPRVTINCSKLHGLFQFAKYRSINETYERQMLSEPLPAWRIAGMKHEGEVWTKGATLRRTGC